MTRRPLLALLTGTLSLSALGALAVPAVAHAASGSELRPTIVMPTTSVVNDLTHVTVNVRNFGNKKSGTVNLVIELPKTATSPNLATMGPVSGITSGSGSCSLSGTRITCTLGGINPNLTSSVGFDIRMPYSSNPIVFSTTVSTTNDTNTSNNSVSRTAAQTYYAVPVPASGQVLTNSHCTGLATLSSYYECVISPSSVTSHLSAFVQTTPTSGTLDFSANGPGGAGAGGTWSISGTQLTVQYTDNGDVVGNFVGQGATATCWDGKMIFTQSANYVSMYRVCL